MNNEWIWLTIFKIVAFIEDGIVWCYATEQILKKLYGYPVKKNKYKTVIYVVIILLNALFAAEIFSFSWFNFCDIFGTSEIIEELLLVYWTFHLKESKKLKGFAVIFISIKLVISTYYLASAIFSVTDFNIGTLKGTFYLYPAVMGIVLLQHIIPFLCIAFFLSYHPDIAESP